MKLIRDLENRLRGWLPKEGSLPRQRRIEMVDRFSRFQFFRLTYGLTMCALLVVPFGVYHSIVEPYVVGSLWGYNLPIGYIGLLLGIMAILYPRLTLRSIRFSAFMTIIGLSLLLTFVFSPSYYFINLLHSTSFSPSQIDVDLALGNSAVLGLSLLSIVTGLISFVGAVKKVTNQELKA